MNIGRAKNIIFDFDGVLAESVDIKTTAFQNLYNPYGPTIVSKVTKHHQEHGGVSRFEKFRHYHGTFLNTPLNDKQIEELSFQFSRLVVEAVVKSDWVKGAKKLLDNLKKNNIPLYVASGTPDIELKEIIKKRNMSDYFVEIGGSPETKSSILQRLVNKHKMPQKHTYMIGDAMTDYQAAMDAEIKFIGRKLINQENPFPSDVVVVDDLSSLVLI